MNDQKSSWKLKRVIQGVALSIAGDITSSEGAGKPVRNSEGIFRILFEKANDAIVFANLSGEIVDINRSAAKLVGMRKEEVVGKSYLKLGLIPPRYFPKILTRLKSTVEGIPTPSFEVAMRRRDSREVLLEVGITLIKENNVPIGFLAIARDETERKQMNRRITESEERLQRLIEFAPEVIYINDLDGRFIDGNRQAEKLLGYKKEELVGKTSVDMGILSEKSMSKLGKMLKKNRKIQKMRVDEIEMTRKDGTKATVEISAFPVKRGGEVEVVNIARDITEQKRMEELLSTLNLHGIKLNMAKNLEEVYKSTLDVIEKTLGFEHAGFAVVEKNRIRIVGYRGRSKPLSTTLPLNSNKKGIVVKVAEERKAILVPDVNKNADYVEAWPSIRSELAVPIISENKVLGVLDMESEELNAFTQKDMILLQVLASHTATAMSNVVKRSESEKRGNQLALLMKNSTVIMHSADLHVRLKSIAEAIRELGWRRVVIRAVKDYDLEIADPASFVTAGLTKKERDFLWANRVSGKVWLERFGPEYERFKIGGFYYLPWGDPWVREKFSRGIVSSKRSPEEMVDWDPQDLLLAPLRLFDGRIVGVLSADDPVDGKQPTQESLAPLELFLHQAAVAIENVQLIHELKQYNEHLEERVNERTRELKEAQERLLKSERLAAIGEAAAMIGHDLRNPLTGISATVYYLKTKVCPKKAKKVLELLRLINDNIEYANNIVNDLLYYSKEMRLDLSETTPRAITKEALSLIEAPKNVQVINSAQNKPRIKMDAAKMKRVLGNLLRNAFDAMLDGGKLTVTSHESDGKVHMIFSDTGTGMSKEVLQKLWTPFFTTKAKGMGLGLAICKRVVEAHGGEISVESNVEKGTTFTVAIPIKPRVEKRGEKIWVNMQESLSPTMTRA